METPGIKLTWDLFYWTLLQKFPWSNSEFWVGGYTLQLKPGSKGVGTTILTCNYRQKPSIRTNLTPSICLSLKLGPSATAGTDRTLLAVGPDLFGISVKQTSDVGYLFFFRIGTTGKGVEDTRMMDVDAVSDLCKKG